MIVVKGHGLSLISLYYLIPRIPLYVYVCMYSNCRRLTISFWLSELNEGEIANSNVSVLRECCLEGFTISGSSTIQSIFLFVFTMYQGIFFGLLFSTSISVTNLLFLSINICNNDTF